MRVWRPGHVFRKIETFETHEVLCRFDERSRVAVAMRDRAMRHALFADARGERARIDARNRRDIVALQPGIEGREAAPVGGMCRIGAHNKPAHRRIDGLDILVVGADDADMREGETDDLARIGRIAQDFLIARHRGIEADLAHSLRIRAKTMAFEDRSVGKRSRARTKFAAGLAAGFVLVSVMGGLEFGEP